MIINFLDMRPDVLKIVSSGGVSHLSLKIHLLASH